MVKSFTSSIGFQGLQGWFLKKAARSFLMSKKADVNWLQDGYAAGQGRAHQGRAVPLG